MRKIGYKVPKTMVQTLFMEALFELSRFAKYTLMLGTYTSFFTASSVIAPLFGSSVTSLSIFSGLLMIRAVLSSFIWFTPVSLLLSYHIPLLIAAFFFGQRSKMATTSFFVLSMVAFGMHPVGFVGLLYAGLWFIPVIARLLGDNLYVRALCSTFAAHAAGSLIFLYTIPSTPELWVGLIPVALCERLIFAGCISGLYIAYIWVSSKVGSTIFGYKTA